MHSVEVLPVKLFSRTDPCTKVHIHNTFWQDGAYRARPVLEGRGIMGLNAIKYMRKNGLVEFVEFKNVDYWQPTEKGIEWISSGLARHLELHPEDAHLVVRGGTKKVARKRRTR